MTKKYMLFGVVVFISTSSIMFLIAKTSDQKDFVFDRRMHTEINGNSAFDYIYSGRQQSNPSYVFKHTRVFACTRDKKLTEVGTFESFEKAYREQYSSSRSEATLEELANFAEFASMNNAIYCADLEQKLNYYDKPENVGAIVYGTQDVKDCALVKEYLKQQEAAKSKINQK